jgi:hypothetical protein
VELVSPAPSNKSGVQCRRSGPGNERQLRFGQLAGDDMDVGAADTAGAPAQVPPSVPARHGPVGELERLRLGSEHHRPHPSMIARTAPKRATAIGSPTQINGRKPIKHQEGTHR